ncbi:MAG: RNA polymerase subunit sigma-70 [Oribacterium sp.]|nr:RNA polymerase subunit sigma-70 [Oribacterium sp.]
MTHEQRKQIISLRSEGLGYKRIADKLGLSINTVKSFCRRQKDNPGISIPAGTKVCLQCGNPVGQIPGRKEKKFCSDKCRMAWWNAHPELVQRKNAREMICPNCGKHFTVFGNVKRKYCSHECYVTYRFGGGYGR